MPKVAIRTIEQAVAADPPPGAEGNVETRVYFDGERQPLHLRLHRLAPGAKLHLYGEGRDHSVYVWEGTVDAGGQQLAARSSAVVDRGASLAAEAGQHGAALLVFNAGGYQNQHASQGIVHLLPNERVPRVEAMGGGKGVGGALHADACEPTPHIWLHENDWAMADHETVLHSHSEDEVIFVRAGSARLGKRLYGRGTALFIAANTLYGFFSGPTGLSFVNFRASSPTYRKGDGSGEMDEAELWRKAVGRPKFVEVVS